MKIKINRDKCVGHGRCAAVAPAIYALDDNGYIGGETIYAPDHLSRDALRGLRACPERIISIEEEAATEGPQTSGALSSGSPQ